MHGSSLGGYTVEGFWYLYLSMFNWVNGSIRVPVSKDSRGVNVKRITYYVLSLSSMGLFLYREILCYPTPINFNYWYGIGLLLVFLLVNQVLTGIQVGSYYIVSIDVALSSVDYLMREITYGWSFRYLHSNGAYWIFTLVYVHLWRGI